MRVSQSGNNPIQGADVGGAKQTGRAGATQNTKQTDRASGAEQAVATDGAKADISARGKEMAKAKELAASAPDVREDKIADLKRRIAEGKYEVNPDAIADRMVNDHLHMGIG